MEGTSPRFSHNIQGGFSGKEEHQGSNPRFTEMKLFTVSALLVAISATSALAHDKSTTRLILELQPGLCEKTQAQILGWARGGKTIGSYALPTLKKRDKAGCDSLVPAVVGLGENALDQAEADKLALSACNKGNADNALLGKCVVVGRLYTVAK